MKGVCLMGYEEILRERLQKGNAEFRRLSKEHSLLDKIVHQMLKRRVLTPKEELNRRRLQVEKLQTKDRMEAIVREERKTMTP